MKIRNKSFLASLLLLLLIIQSSVTFAGESLLKIDSIPILKPKDIRFGADQLIESDSIWKGRKLVLVVNHSSVLSNGEHLVDALHKKGAYISHIYAPEHGFRGDADAGETISSGIDVKTGLPIYSLYGNKKKPDPEELGSIDLIIFDIQDVGVRFYTYLSTMYYIMEVAAETSTDLYVLDRPNPNGYYVDGPVLDTSFQSFVGIIPIPIVHGMTLGELAMMIKGEELIRNTEQLDLQIMPCIGYTHQSTYDLPIAPSPNLPNLRSILLYPSLCYFEACLVSVGRGTHKQFQQIGSPYVKNEFSYTFIPQPMKGAQHPKFEGDTCYGVDLSSIPYSELTQKHIYWEYLFEWNSHFTIHSMVDRINFMNLLMGTDTWQLFLKNDDLEAWEDSYQEQLELFKKTRSKYLLYPD